MKQKHKCFVGNVCPDTCVYRTQHSLKVNNYCLNNTSETNTATTNVTVLGYCSHQMALLGITDFSIRGWEKVGRSIGQRIMHSYPPKLLSDIAMKRCRIHMGVVVCCVSTQLSGSLI